MKDGGAASVLNPRELALLTDVWEIWAESAPTPARGVARARTHLFFLLARFGGLRPAEIGALNPLAACDLAGGLLKINERRLFLPAAALRPLRRILTLPECAEPGFLRLDDGFIRKTFYAVSELAKLPATLCAPRALRYARALELLTLSVPPHLVAKTLGFSSPLRLAGLMRDKGGGERNSFAALLTRVETGSRSARLFFELPGGEPLYCLCGLDELLDLETEPGRMVDIEIPPGSLLPEPYPKRGGNILDCRVLSVGGDHLEILLELRSKAGLELLAALDPLVAERASCAVGQSLALRVPARAVKLRARD